MKIGADLVVLINGLHLKNIRGDVLGGLTAAVVALPLALAFGEAALGDGGAIYGLYGAVVVGFLAALFGGTPAQVSGPTGPMSVTVAGVIASLTAIGVNPDLGAGEILLTSMDSDGTKKGFDLKLTKTISEQVNIPVIASGGAGNPSSILEVLTKGKADAALAASIFHYNKYSIKEVKNYLKYNLVEVRK